MSQKPIFSFLIFMLHSISHIRSTYNFKKCTDEMNYNPVDLISIQISALVRYYSEGAGDDDWCHKEPRGVAPKIWKITPVLVLSGYKLLLKARARRSPDLTGTGTSVYTQLYRYRYYRSNDRQPSRTIWGGCGRAVSQKVRVFGLKTLFLKRFTVRSTTRTLIIDKTDHSAFTAIWGGWCPKKYGYSV